MWVLLLLVLLFLIPYSYKKSTPQTKERLRAFFRSSPSRTSLPDEPLNWRNLDAVGHKELAAAAANLARTTPLGLPVGATPAGNYVGIYWQYGSTHPIAAQELACMLSDEVSGTAAGHGFDDVGTFSLSGVFKLAKLCLTKQYQLGTGNPRENSGHQVQLRLTCCELHAALPQRSLVLQQWGAPLGVVGFYGSWHIRTHRYNGDAEMCLWLPPEPVVIGHVITQITTITTSMLNTAIDTDGDGLADAMQQVMTETAQTTTNTVTTWGQRIRHPFGPKRAQAPVPTAMPMAQTAMPMAQTAVPMAQTAVPMAQTAVPMAHSQSV